MSDNNCAQPENLRLSQQVPGFLAHARVELDFSGQTILKYKDCLRQIARMIGDFPVTEYSKDHIFALKSAMLARNHSVGRQVTILAAFKRMLLFCQGVLALPVLDPELIVMPKTAATRGRLPDQSRGGDLCFSHSIMQRRRQTVRVWNSFSRARGSPAGQRYAHFRSAVAESAGHRFCCSGSWGDWKGKQAANRFLYGAGRAVADALSRNPER